MMMCAHDGFLTLRVLHNLQARRRRGHRHRLMPVRHRPIGSPERFLPPYARARTG